MPEFKTKKKLGEEAAAATRSLSPTPPPEPEPIATEKHQTEPDDFGLYHKYTTWPTIDPEANVVLDDLLEAPTFASKKKQRSVLGTGVLVAVL
jgi:hypothetical protein